MTMTRRRPGPNLPARRVCAILLWAAAAHGLEMGTPARAGPGGLARRSAVPRAALDNSNGVTVYEERADFTAVTAAFVDSFWANKAETGALSEAQAQQLRKEQQREFRRRYGSAETQWRRSALLVAMRGDETVGCVGVELDGAADDTAKIPVMSNLAVAKAGRRRGVGTKLVEACEAKCGEWGYDSLDLLVESTNMAAQKLYSKLGYKVIDRDEDASTLVPLADGRIETQKTTTLLMRRENISSSARFGGVAAIVGLLGGGALALGAGYGPFAAVDFPPLAILDAAGTLL